MRKLFIILFWFICLSLEATNYYVKTGGLDAANGLTDGTAWATITKVNSFWATGSFNPGDNIYFKKGDVFYGTITVSESGSVGLPITISAYGTGNNPIISGFTTLTSWTDNGNDVYYTTLDAPRLNVVILNGVVKGMGRFPNTGYLTYENHNANLSITDDQLNGSPDWTGAEIVIRKDRWILDRHIITNHADSILTYNSLADYGHNDNYSPQSGNGYFFQNDIKCLDDIGDWYYNIVTKRLYMFFGGSPVIYTVKAGSLNEGIIINNKSYIDILNLDFEGTNRNCISLISSSYINILNCNLSAQGESAIYGYTSTNIKIKGCTITDGLNNGIWFETGGNNLIIDAVTTTNIGNIIGSGRSGDAACEGIGIMGNDNIIKNCKVSNIGYIGIAINGDNYDVDSNYVNSTCLVKDDGGGIYTYGVHAGVSIHNNIVLNSTGSYLGAESYYWEPYGKASGIYVDGSASNVLVYNNTIANCDWNGVFINLGSDNSITNNTIFNCRSQVGFYSYTDTPIRNTILTGNFLITKDTSQACIDIRSFGNENPSLLGTYDNNYYVKPYSNLNLFYYRPSFFYSLSVFTFNEWKGNVGEDTSSHISLFSVADSSDIDFYCNTTQNNIIIPLSQQMIDVSGVLYRGGVILQPFTSIVLMPNPFKVVRNNGNKVLRQGIKLIRQ
jgi:parallel beta-helix repeat protein